MERHSSIGSIVLQQYYLAIDTARYKTATFTELLDIISVRGKVPVAVCCSSRDVCDILASVISTIKSASLQFLHSDMDESEHAASVEQFRRLCMQYTARHGRADGGGGGGIEEQSERGGKQGDGGLHVMVITDACLPTASLGESPLGVRLLINYELPLKKEAYIRRIGACLGPAAAVAADKSTEGGGGASAMKGLAGLSPVGGIVINFVTAGEVPILRSIEEACGICIDEMPINICELL